LTRHRADRRTANHDLRSADRDPRTLMRVPFNVSQSLSMRYAAYAPSPHLCQIVERYRILEGPGSGEPEPVFPDGRVEIVLHYGAPFRRHLADGCVEHQGRGLVAGQMTEPVLLSHEGIAGVAAICLRPAAAKAVLRVAASHVAAQIVDVDAILPSSRALRERLTEAHGDLERVRLLERWLTQLAPVPPPLTVQNAVEDLVAGRGRSDIACVATRAGLGRRTLERLFAEHVGVAPKAFARIVRLQHALHLIRAGQPLAQIAVECGYYDQAHMALEFKSLAERSPIAWRDQHSALSHLFISRI
jgi:AraC-like DNA-binding protein